MTKPVKVTTEEPPEPVQIPLEAEIEQPPVVSVTPPLITAGAYFSILTLFLLFIRMDMALIYSEILFVCVCFEQLLSGEI